MIMAGRRRAERRKERTGGENGSRERMSLTSLDKGAEGIESGVDGIVKGGVEGVAEGGAEGVMEARSVGRSG